MFNLNSGHKQTHGKAACWKKLLEGGILFLLQSALANRFISCKQTQLGVWFPAPRRNGVREGKGLQAPVLLAASSGHQAAGCVGQQELGVRVGRAVPGSGLGSQGLWPRGIRASQGEGAPGAAWPRAVFKPSIAALTEATHLVPKSTHVYSLLYYSGGQGPLWVSLGHR